MKILNVKQAGDYGFVVFFNNQQVGVYASSLYDAKLKGIAHFKPRKSQAHMVHAHLAEDSQGDQVTHSTGSV